jgi:hypothetical protein
VANQLAGTITIYGSSFDSSSNDVWFTSATATTPSGDPRVRVLGVASAAGGKRITVAIPAAAGPGDVLVDAGAGSEFLSNAFPTDLAGVFGFPPPASKFKRVPELGELAPAVATPPAPRLGLPGSARGVDAEGDLIPLELSGRTRRVPATDGLSRSDRR